MWRKIYFEFELATAERIWRDDRERRSGGWRAGGPRSRHYPWLVWERDESLPHKYLWVRGECFQNELIWRTARRPAAPWPPLCQYGRPTRSNWKFTLFMPRSRPPHNLHNYFCSFAVKNRLEDQPKIIRWRIFKYTGTKFRFLCVDGNSCERSPLYGSRRFR